MAALKVSPRSQPLQVKICESPSNTTTSPSANLDSDDFNQQKMCFFAKKNYLLFYAPPSHLYTSEGSVQRVATYVIQTKPF